MLTVCCGALCVCCCALIFDLVAVKKQIKSLRGDLDNLANFSLKHIQENTQHE